MADIGRSLDEIDSKVRKLNETLKQSTDQTKELDKAIKLDPKATEIATQRIQNLQTQIGLATQKVVLLKQRQLEANKAFENGDMTAKEFSKIQVSVMRAENQLRQYSKELRDATQGPAISGVNNLAKGFDGVTNTLKGSQQALRTFSRMALALVTTMAGAIVAFAKSTQELNAMSKAYDVNIEKLQLQRNIYKEITGDADNYNKSLDSLKKTLSAIVLGQGSGYANILNHIGVSTVDAEGKTKSLSQVYDEVISALSQMEDEQLRNKLAYELFGDEAINILEILGMTAEQIEELNRQTVENGIVTSESAAAAQAVQEQWDGVRQQFMQVGAELAEKLLPLIQSLAEFVAEFILPIITAIANWFANMSPFQQKFMLFLLMLIIILPKVISFVTIIVGIIKAITVACYGASGGVGAVSAAATPLIPIMLAVVAVVLVLALLFAFLTGRSKDLSKSLEGQKKQMDGIASSYEDMGEDMDITTSQVGSNSNTQSSEVNVTIDSRGDSPIARENAELVADILADRINKELGAKI